MSAALTLKAFQQRMAAAVMAPVGGSAADAAAWVRPNARMKPWERLEIYRRQYWFRLLGSLEDDFPGLMAVLGRNRFHHMMRAYLAECPSTSFSLRGLASRLEAWLRQNRHWLAPQGALALDMARLEWAHIEAFDAAEEPALAPTAASDIHGASRLGLQPCLRLLRLSYPVDDLVIQVRRAGDGSAPATSRAVAARRGRLVHRAAALAPEPIFLAVHRQDQSVYYKRLDPEAFRILEALGSGAGLGSALETGFADSPMPEASRPAFLQKAFQGWSAQGWIVRPGTWSRVPFSDGTAGSR